MNAGYTDVGLSAAFGIRTTFGRTVRSSVLRNLLLLWRLVV